jgi:hypothetical protein
MVSRPLKPITDETKERLCLAIADGMTIRQVCKLPGMPASSTIYLALARDASFAEQYARAREAQLIRWEDELLEIADNSTNDWVARESGEKAGTDHDHIQRSRLRVEARKWIMSKRLPRVYGDRLDLNAEVKQTYDIHPEPPSTEEEWLEKHGKPQQTLNS